jgi:hypothetical protein
MKIMLNQLYLLSKATIFEKRANNLDRRQNRLGRDEETTCQYLVMNIQDRNWSGKTG